MQRHIINKKTERWAAPGSALSSNMIDDDGNIHQQHTQIIEVIHNIVL